MEGQLEVVFSKEEIRSLSSDQQDAILEAMVVAAVANAKAGGGEDSFMREARKIPWAQPKEEMIEKAQAAQARVLAQKSDEEHVALLKSIAARLSSGRLAEKTLATMGLIMGAADRSVDATEQNTLLAYAVAFGINAGRVQEIADAIRG